jgi:hypothetical protein
MTPKLNENSLRKQENFQFTAQRMCNRVLVDLRLRKYSMDLFSAIGRNIESAFMTLTEGVRWYEA